VPTKPHMYVLRSLALPLCGCVSWFDGSFPTDADVFPDLATAQALEASTGESSGDGEAESQGGSIFSPEAEAAADATTEANVEGSTGDDAQPDDGGPTCGSNAIAPATAVASTVVAPDLATNAVDGLLTTRWVSVSGVDPQWLDVDFGAPVFIREVDVLWEAACAENYDLEVSSDAMTWTTIPNGTITGNTVAATLPGNPPAPPVDWTKAVVTKPLAAVGRYLRVNGTMRCTVYGYSIWEMRVYGDSNAECTP
jgi:hypothetical protein